MKPLLFLTTMVSIATIIMVGIRHHSLILILLLVGLVGYTFLSNWEKDEEHPKSMCLIAIVTVLIALLGV